MKSYQLIYNNEPVGYRINTETGLGIVDIDIETAEKYDIKPDVLYSLQLYNNHGQFITREEQGRRQVRDISTDRWICSSLAILMNEDIASENSIKIYIGDSLKNFLGAYAKRENAYADKIISGFQNSNSLSLLFCKDDAARTEVMIQAAKRMLQKGIHISRIAFCSVEAGAEMRVVNSLLQSLYNHFKMKYIFVDNFSNAEHGLFGSTIRNMELDYCLDKYFCTAKYVFSSPDKHYFDEYVSERRLQSYVNIVDMG